MKMNGEGGQGGGGEGVAWSDEREAGKRGKLEVQEVDNDDVTL